MPKPPTKVVFTVRGQRNFPFDMLRYDAAYPTDKGVSALSHLTSPHRSERLNDVTDVELVGTVGRITKDRWASFGWRVVEERTRSY